MSPVAKVVAVVAAHVLPVAEKIASALPVAENLVLATSCDLWAGCRAGGNIAGDGSRYNDNHFYQDLVLQL